MADVNFSVNLTFTAIDKSLNKTFENLEKTGVKSTEKISKNIDKMGDGAKKIAGGFAGIDLSFLSLMFGGMALEKMFKGLFNTVVDSYRQMSDENSAFNKGVKSLTNAFDFLKYSFGKAFAESPFVQTSLDNLKKTLDGVSMWVQNNTSIASFLISLAGALGLLGTAIVLMGTYVQWFGMGGTFSTMIDKLKLLSKTLTNNKIKDYENFFSLFSGRGFVFEDGGLFTTIMNFASNSTIQSLVVILAILGTMYWLIGRTVTSSEDISEGWDAVAETFWSATDPLEDLLGLDVDITNQLDILTAVATYFVLSFQQGLIYIISAIDGILTGFFAIGTWVAEMGVKVLKLFNNLAIAGWKFAKSIASRNGNFTAVKNANKEIGKLEKLQEAYQSFDDVLDDVQYKMGIDLADRLIANDDRILEIDKSLQGGIKGIYERITAERKLASVDKKTAASFSVRTELPFSLGYKYDNLDVTNSIVNKNIEDLNIEQEKTEEISKQNGLLLERLNTQNEFENQYSQLMASLSSAGYTPTEN